MESISYKGANILESFVKKVEKMAVADVQQWRTE
jgi:hypothetical protein